MAVILHDGPALGGPSGWHMESWARCNPAEFPESVTSERGLEIWTDDAGKRVPTYRVVSSTGPEHCNWTSMRFLTLDESDRAYVLAVGGPEAGVRRSQGRADCRALAPDHAAADVRLSWT